MGNDFVSSSEALLLMLKEYSISHVFGLPGETTLPLYDAWLDFKDVEHVRVRDERNAVIAADGYARVTFKPGVVEAPGVGASYLLPGLAEAYRSRIPIIVFVSDITEDDEYKNVLTEYRKDLMFKDVTKDVLIVHSAEMIPRVIRRAFRLATAGIPGPVYVRIPYNAWEGKVSREDIYAQREFAKYPALRFEADDESVSRALELLLKADRPVIICGQGVLLSQGWDEVLQLAEALSIPVGTTITGKGCFPETHVLSIGVVGKRGGTRFSNSIVNEADLIFFIGTNTDSANTADWSVPPITDKDKVVIHLDVDEATLGNVYRTSVFLLGDAKATIRKMLRALGNAKKYRNEYISRLKKLRDEWDSYVESLIDETAIPVNPLLFIKKLEKLTQSGDYVFTADPGIGAIYTSAFYRISRAGRTFMYNYSLGGLGFALPMALGAHLGSRKVTIALTTDGNLAFNMGELETLKTLNVYVKVIVFNNLSYGWIRATMLSKYGPRFFHTDFSSVDFVKIAEAHGIKADRVDKPSELEERLKMALTYEGPYLLEIPALPEDKLMPPVPEWRNAAEKYDIPYLG